MPAPAGDSLVWYSRSDVEVDPALFQDNDRQAPAESGRATVETGALDLVAGGRLERVTVAYETWGRLNAARDNAVLVCHALSGDSHAIGWWDRIVGPGLAIDTDKYFVICANSLGGCQGTTGPASLAGDGKPYGSRFPTVSVEDMAECHHRLLAHLNVGRLKLACGGSMGGMQALALAVAHPHEVENVWLTACAARHSALQIGFNETGRQAVMRDPKWQGGDYDPGDPPSDGLAVARMVGHLSYLSESSFQQKFGRRLQEGSPGQGRSQPQFQVESYLSYQGEKFTKRFDANSYLVLTQAIDRYECDSLQRATCGVLLTSFTSDWLYPSWQSAELQQMAVQAGLRCEWADIDLPYGHDSFLLDGEGQARAVRQFLA